MTDSARASSRTSGAAVPAGSGGEATDAAPDPVAYDPADPWAGWEELSTAARVERLAAIVRRLHAATAVP